jgi:TP901-1 family phage major tail protein
MAAQKGRAFLLKDGSAAAGTLIAAMRVTRFAINNQTVDVTTKDSNGFRALLAGAAAASMQISAQGILDANAQATTLINRCLTGSIDPYGIVVDNADKIDANCQLTSFEAEGSEGDAQTYSLTLESSGTITVTAA